MTTPLRPLPPLNDNYTPAREWVCCTREAHDCTGPVVGAMGALPVCAAGAFAEHAAQERDRRRIDAWLASPDGRRAMADEARLARHEARHA